MNTDHIDCPNWARPKSGGTTWIGRAAPSGGQNSPQANPPTESDRTEPGPLTRAPKYR
jgi:hypothetical protein